MPGRGDPAPVALSYEWQRDGVAIAGAIGTSYAPVPADVGAVLTVAVTGERYLYEPVTVSSPGRQVGVDLVAGSPTISGPVLPQVKDALLAAPGTWGPEGVALTYQWYRGSTAIPGATSSFYVIGAADDNASLSVAVTGTLPDHEPVTARSSAVRVGLGGVIGPRPSPV